LKIEVYNLSLISIKNAITFIQKMSPKSLNLTPDEYEALVYISYKINIYIHIFFHLIIYLFIYLLILYSLLFNFFFFNFFFFNFFFFFILFSFYIYIIYNIYFDFQCNP